MHLLYGGFNFANSSSFGEGFSNFVHDRSVFWQVWNWISDHAAHAVEWLKQPRKYLFISPRLSKGPNASSIDVLALVMAWWITFTVVLLLLFAIGFNPIGIGAGASLPCRS